MKRPTLSAQPRSVRGKAVATLRRTGQLPAVVYGAKRESEAIAVDAREFETLQRHAGRNAVVDLVLDGSKPQPVMLHATQEHPVTRRTLHADFLVVDLEEERTVDVPLAMVGASEAVDRLGGVLLHMRDTIRVRAKPDDLPSAIELDITPLADFDAVLHVSDLVMPAGVALVTEPTEQLARVQPPRVEEEPVVEAPAEEGEVVEGEEETTAEAEGTAESAAPDGEEREAS